MVDGGAVRWQDAGLMAGLQHRIVDADGTRIHLVEQGEGPLVLLVHGFPESWYSWRHQLPALADAGFRAVAIDVRGYGRSSSPAAVEAYGMLAHVADNLGVVAALGERRRRSSSATTGVRPSRPTRRCCGPTCSGPWPAVACPYARPGRRRPTEVSRRMGGDEEFYINYFQEPGRAEAEIEADVRAWLLGFYIGASGDAMRPADGGTHGDGQQRAVMLKDRFVIPDPLPAWLDRSRSGLLRRRSSNAPASEVRSTATATSTGTGWTSSPWSGQPITVPSLFIGGERDGPTCWGAAGHRPLRRDAARPARQPHPRRLRPLGAAGARRRGQPDPDRVARGL